MFEHFSNLHPVLQALLGTCFTWLMTAFGAAVVFWRRDISRKVLDWMLGFAAGVMIAASFWSLLAPAIAMSENNGVPGWLPAAVGFLSGGIVLRLIDRILPHLHLGLPVSKAEGLQTGWKRSTLLVMAITLHNIPEGLAVGVAFGAAAADIPSATLAGALALALGIGIQNSPRGWPSPCRCDGKVFPASRASGSASSAEPSKFSPASPALPSSCRARRFFPTPSALPQGR